MLDLNTGRSAREVAKKYSIETQEVVDIYNKLDESGFVVAENFGKIKRSNPSEDIDIFPYLFMMLVMVIGQVFYFSNIARTALMERTVEGIAVAGAAVAAIFFHEFGHYLFCLWYTHVRPAMRFTFMKVFPVVYVDTNLAWKLPKQKNRISIC